MAARLDFVRLAASCQWPPNERSIPGDRTSLVERLDHLPLPLPIHRQRIALVMSQA
jgi:hypothetical protein